ncbi:MAG: phosphoribosyl-ATP pyrophosphohydrolase [Candidatus Fimenecus sp.]
MVQRYNKLVRDRIPELCRQNNQIAGTAVLDDEAYRIALREKLMEEVQEFLDSDAPEELADILEVVDALAQLQAISFTELIKYKSEKASRNGGFQKRLFLKEVRNQT